jgi:hypothetical protein
MTGCLCRLLTIHGEQSPNQANPGGVPRMQQFRIQYIPASGIRHCLKKSASSAGESPRRPLNRFNQTLSALQWANCFHQLTLVLKSGDIS